ncbi:hypothetical protein JB92DRAFT_2719161, partial [Gautieria morchelliformis]
HLLTHSGERPFQCTYPGCGRRFTMACNMQRHMRTHTSESAFQTDTTDDGDRDTQHSRHVAANLVAKDQVEVVLVAMICGQAVVDTRENLSFVDLLSNCFRLLLPPSPPQLIGIKS